MPSMDSMYVGTHDIVEAVIGSDPRDRDVNARECEPDFYGRRVRWIGTGYIIEVSVNRVHFMEDNIWNFSHAAGVMRAMEEGLCFEVPVARVHRIRASDVQYTQAYAKRGELEYQSSLTRPWTRADIGQYTAQLIDGNHRAVAAMALGEKVIWVYVSENYRGEVRKKDWA